MNSYRVSFQVTLMALASLMMNGCFNRDRQPIYVQSEEVPEIQVPDDLSLPPVQRTYDIPGVFLPELAGAGNEARPPVVMSSAEAEASRSHIRFGPTGLYLEVEDEVSSVWRRLGFTLNRGGMTVRDVVEADRRYDFDFTHDPIQMERSGMSRLFFWQSGNFMDYSGAFQVRLDAEGNNTRVLLLNRDGNVVGMDQAEFVLAVLRERLG
ncbi:MAG: hypothetical protein AAGJ52_02770 [Pseudomonadota bacterium]